jgi:hypothetical protein
MQTVSTDHLAEILVGIARTQAAVVQALKGDTRVIEALQADARQDSLSGLPTRLLLASLRRTGLETQAIAQELARLCGRDDARPTDYNP